MLNVKFKAPPGYDVRLTSKFVKSFSYGGSLKGSKDFSLNGVEVIKSCKM